MKKSRKEFLDENLRPLPEGCTDWWKFCEKNSKNLAKIPTFEEFKQNKFDFVKTDLI